VTDMIALTPPGYRFELLFGAYLKYALEHESDPRQRLDMLEALEGLSHDEMPLTAIAALAPMPAVGVEIMHTAFELDRARDGMKGCPASYGILTRDDVFRKLLAINPSIVDAITIYHHRGEAPAT
jgi:hypothetical protein